MKPGTSGLAVILAGAAIVAAVPATGVAAVPQTYESEREARLRSMDRDNDGVITRAEWAGSADGFRRRDRNGDGVLSGDEVRQLGDGRGDGAAELRAVFTRADRNANGRLERDEWYGNEAAFDRIDADHDGAISRTEFLGGPVGTSGRGTFAGRDRNGNGVITTNEWDGDPAEFRRRDADGDGVLTREEYRESSETESPAYRAGRERGLADGRQAGREDKTINGGRWDLDGQRELETADAGYAPVVGSREDYQRGYRAGFRTGYREGFGPRER
jgi:Ca2+-binding EF-hand superfamily protein